MPYLSPKQQYQINKHIDNDTGDATGNLTTGLGFQQ